MTANDLDDVKSVRIFPDADNDYAFVGNVVRGKSTLFRLVMRNTFVLFVWKVFARRKLLRSTRRVLGFCASALDCKNSLCLAVCSGKILDKL